MSELGISAYPTPQDLRITRSSYGAYQDAWQTVRPEFRHNLLSTSYEQASIGYLWFTVMHENRTSVRGAFLEASSDLLEEARSLSKVNVSDANANVFEIRRVAGLSWAKLADMLNVDRRTVHNWIKGRRVRDKNRRRIADTLDTLQRIDRGSAQENLVLLGNSSPCGLTIFKLMKEMRYEEVLQAVATTAGSRDSQNRAARTGEFQAMAMHRGADGSELIERLPFDPQPPGRKRALKRD